MFQREEIWFFKHCWTSMKNFLLATCLWVNIGMYCSTRLLRKHIWECYWVIRTGMPGGQQFKWHCLWSLLPHQIKKFPKDFWLFLCFSCAMIPHLQRSKNLWIHLLKTLEEIQRKEEEDPPLEIPTIIRGNTVMLHWLNKQSFSSF